MGSAFQSFNMQTIIHFCLLVLLQQVYGECMVNGLGCSCANPDCTEFVYMKPGDWKKGGCFPGTAEVTLASGGRKKMKELQIGDEVLTSSGTFSAVLGWLDIQPGQETNFIKLETNLSSSTSMTGSHVIFSRSVKEEAATPKYAEEVKMGDLIIEEEAGELAEVVKISRFSSVGYYAPLTYEGTVVVDGYLASCYASYPHWVAHAALYTARAWPAIFLGEKEGGGTGTFVTAVKTLGDMLKIRDVAIPALAMMDAAKQEL